MCGRVNEHVKVCVRPCVCDTVCGCQCVSVTGSVRVRACGWVDSMWGARRTNPGVWLSVPEGKEAALRVRSGFTP